MTFDPDVGDGAQFMDVAQLQAALAGFSLVDPATDCEVTPADAGGLAVDVSSGTARLGGPAESISAQSDVALPSSDPDDPRKALVYLDETGAVQTLGGDPAPAAPPNEERAKAAVPSVPIPASDYLPLASVWIPAGATTITSGDIRSRRVSEVVRNFTDVRGEDPADPSRGRTWLRRNPFSDNTGEFQSSGQRTNSVALSSEYFAYGGDGNNVYIYSFPDFSLVETLTESSNSITSVALSDDYIAYGVSFSGGVYIHNTSDWSLEYTLTDGGSESVNSVAFSDQFFTSATDNNNEVYVYDVADFSLVETLTEATEPPSSVTISTDYIAYCEGFDGDSTYVYSTTDWSLVQTLTESAEPLNSVDIFGSYIAYGGRDNVVYIHDTADWSLVETLTEATDWIGSVSFSENYIAYGSNDGNVYIHEYGDWVSFKTISGGNIVNSVSILSEYLAIGTEGTGEPITFVPSGTLSIYNGFGIDRFNPL